MTPPSIPIACDPYAVTQHERAKALELGLNVIRRWPTKIEELTEGYLFHYQGDPQRWLELARFVNNETRCCPWASFALELDATEAGKPNSLRLRMTGPAEGKALLAQGFEYLEQHHAELQPEIDAGSAEAFVQGWVTRQRSA